MGRPCGVDRREPARPTAPRIRTPRALVRVLASVAVAVALTACGLPHDPNGTTDRVEGGRLHVGVITDEPWASFDADGTPHGVEVDLIRRFAATLDARPSFVEGTEEDLMLALEHGTVDVVIGGLTTDDAWSAHTAFTRPYLETVLEIAVPPGTPFDVDGVRVAVEPASEAEALVVASDAVAAPVDDVTEVTGPLAVEGWQARALGLRDTGVHLRTAAHVMAVQAGENGFLVRLERFLGRNHAAAARLLSGASP